MVQKPPPPADTSLLYFLPTAATVLNEKPSSEPQNAGSGCEAESRSLPKDSAVGELRRANQLAGASQLAGPGKSHKQALFWRELFRNPSYKTVFAETTLLLSLPLNEMPQMDLGTNCPFSSGRRWHTTLALGQPVPPQLRLYGPECYRNRFV